MAIRISITARRMRYMLYVLFGLIVADGILSDFLVSQNLGWESNPFLQTLVGGEQFLLLKVCGALVIMLILWNIYTRHPRLAFTSSLLFVLFYTVVVYWNIFAFALSVA